MVNFKTTNTNRLQKRLHREQQPHHEVLGHSLSHNCLLLLHKMGLIQAIVPQDFLQLGGLPGHAVPRVGLGLPQPQTKSRTTL